MFYATNCLQAVYQELQKALEAYNQAKCSIVADDFYKTVSHFKHRIQERWPGALRNGVMIHWGSQVP